MLNETRLHQPSRTHLVTVRLAIISAAFFERFSHQGVPQNPVRPTTRCKFLPPSSEFASCPLEREAWPQNSEHPFTNCRSSRQGPLRQSHAGRRHRGDPAQRPGACGSPASPLLRLLAGRRRAGTERTTVRPPGQAPGPKTGAGARRFILANPVPAETPPKRVSRAKPKAPAAD